MEQTYIMLKPDAVNRKLVGKIIDRIENKGFSIVAMKMMQLDKEIVKRHYAHLQGLNIFPTLVSFMISGPVIAMVVQGEDVIQGMRVLIGKTNWLEATPGTIRGDFAYNTTFNLIHGSDSLENANIEITRFFPELHTGGINK